MSGSRKQVAIVGPDLRLAHIQRTRQVNCIDCSQRDILGEAPDQGYRPPQQRIAHGYEVPEIALDMASEHIHQFAALRHGKRPLPHMTMKNSRHFEQRPGG